MLLYKMLVVGIGYEMMSDLKKIKRWITPRVDGSGKDRVFV